jgi:hypothetical protein
MVTPVHLFENDMVRVFQEITALGGAYIAVEVQRCEGRQWVYDGTVYDSPEDLAQFILSEKHYVNLLHYPYFHFPQGPTREYAPVYEICRAALLPAFAAILLRLIPERKLSETQNFFGFDQYRAVLQRTSEHKIRMGEISKYQLSLALAELDGAAENYKIENFCTDIEEYIKCQLQHVKYCKSLKSVKREAEYNPCLPVNKSLKEREQQLGAMNSGVFDRFVRILGSKRLTKILTNDLGSDKFERSDYYDKKETNVRGIYNKVVGWPDISAFRGEEVHFFEVKTNDQISSSQRRMFKRLIEELDLPVSVVHVIDQNKGV